MSTSVAIPALTPSLVLDFINVKSLDPRISFSRNTIATRFNALGVLETVSANQPRLDYNPITLEPMGLLIEEQKTNNFIWSESFRTRTLGVTITSGTFIDGETVTSSVGGGTGVYYALESTSTSFVLYTATNTFSGVLTGSTSGATANINTNVAAWISDAVSVTPNNTISPDGSNTADLLGPSGAGTLVRACRQGLTTSVTGDWTFSLFVKNNNLSNNLIALRIRDNTTTNDIRANFDLSTFSVPTISVLGSWVAGKATVTRLGNNWARISISGNLNTSFTSLSNEIYLGGYQGTAETIGSVYIWGAQLEVGAFPTSYIPTTAASVTRFTDTATINDLYPWFDAQEGTLFAESMIANSGLSSGYRYPGAASLDADAFNSIHLFYTINQSLSIKVTNSEIYTGNSNTPSAIQFGSSNNPTISDNAVNKQAVMYKFNDANASNNGSSGTVDTNVVLPQVNKLRIGANRAASPLNGWVRKIMYYSVRLTEAQANSLTL